MTEIEDIEVQYSFHSGFKDYAPMSFACTIHIYSDYLYIFEKKKRLLSFIRELPILIERIGSESKPVNSKIKNVLGFDRNSSRVIPVHKTLTIKGLPLKNKRFVHFDVSFLMLSETENQILQSWIEGKE